MYHERGAGRGSAHSGMLGGSDASLVNAMNPTPSPGPRFDRSTEDIGNIVEFGHVNLRVPDQQLAIVFYVMGLGLTRDPYLVTGVDNAWINVGTCQFHLPVGPAQVLRGRIGLVMGDLDALVELQIAVADFSGVHRRLLERGLVSEESNQSQYRFENITDVETGEVLVTLEHEVRSMRHPMYARALVNRNPATTNKHYATGHEAVSWQLPPG